MVIDGFTFFNELDVLEIRLNELSPYVDCFVLVEATKTHSNQPKPLYFDENKERFAQFLPKIKHIIVDDLPDDPDPWVRESFQRKMIIDRGFVGFPDLAIGMISDADEIPSGELVSNIQRSLVEAGQAITVMQLFCYFYANTLLVGDGQAAHWAGTRIAQIHSWKGLTGREGCGAYLYGGWHMSYLGGPKAVEYKLQSYAHHQDEDHKTFTPEYIVDRMSVGRTLREHAEQLATVKLGPLGWPKYLRDNQVKFAHLIAK